MASLVPEELPEIMVPIYHDIKKIEEAALNRLKDRFPLVPKALFAMQTLENLQVKVHNKYLPIVERIPLNLEPPTFSINPIDLTNEIQDYFLQSLGQRGLDKTCIIFSCHQYPWYKFSYGQASMPVQSLNHNNRGDIYEVELDSQRPPAIQINLAPIQSQLGLYGYQHIKNLTKKNVFEVEDTLHHEITHIKECHDVKYFFMCNLIEKYYPNEDIACLPEILSFRKSHEFMAHLMPAMLFSHLSREKFCRESASSLAFGYFRPFMDQPQPLELLPLLTKIINIQQIIIGPQIVKNQATSSLQNLSNYVYAALTSPIATCNNLLILFIIINMQKK
jgi:hypothetical protein